MTDPNGIENNPQTEGLHNHATSHVAVASKTGTPRMMVALTIISVGSLIGAAALVLGNRETGADLRSSQSPQSGAPTLSPVPVVVMTAPPEAPKPPPAPSSEDIGRRAWRARISAGDVDNAVGSAMLHAKWRDGQIWDTIAEWPGGPNYGQIERSPDRWYGEACKFSGRVLEVHDNPDGSVFMRVGTGSYGSKPIAVMMPTISHSGQDTDWLIEGSYVGFAGFLTGSYSYVSQAGWNISIPSVLLAGLYKK